jgi:hypothetical protein
MKVRLAILALFFLTGLVCRAYPQNDYLTDGEVDAVRDAQEPDKRMILWMDLAQRRVDAVKKDIATFKPESGRAIQKTLEEYIRIMEELDSTIQDARDRRVPLKKGLQDVATRANLYLNYLRTLDSDAIPGYRDFEYTLDEAMDMTRDELAEVAKGEFPEVEKRTPPTDLPPPSARPPSKSAPQEAPQEEGPPRKSQHGR